MIFPSLAALTATPTPSPVPAPETEQLTGIAAWAVNIMETLGGFGAALLIALENLFPPLPSEVILPLAGFTASRGSMSLPAVLAWTTAGSVVGALALYGLGAALGRDRTRKIFNKLPLVKIEDVDRTEAWFVKYGKYTVFFGRMIPIFRSLISIPAGVTKMNLWLFTLLTTIGSLIWNSVLVGAGYLLGEQWHVVEVYVGNLSKVVLAIIVIAVIVWVGFQLWNRRKAKGSSSR
ncbi:DedA family protein [Buchananella felis]|uniref:DedA family protein n=1 Tax=Buchananella felis TaxID=3231492 RepID=UPI0035298844